MASVGTSRPIKIVQIITERDENGYEKEQERLIYTGWATVRQTNGFREYAAGQQQFGTGKEFRIRNNQQLIFNTDTRLIYAGKTYTITSIDRDGEKKFWWIVRGNAIDQGENTPIS
jgi:SPP1 family predicted phage head-tail adaptor